MLNRKHLLNSTIIAGLAAAALAAPAAALAQTAPTPAQAAEEPAEVEELIVTGSRIKRNEFNSAQPIQVITSETTELKGVVTAAQMLQGSTIASGSPQVNSTISSAFVTDGGPGAQTISLRGLGANRTLVLLNGRRAGPAGVRGAVSAFDLNVLPQTAVDRIEILKDGASSVYGSDAVAGVVNIITKRNLDGGEFQVTGVRPFEEGGEQYKISGSWGKTFSKGYFSITGDYFKQKEQKVGDRDFTSCAEQYRFNPATGARSDIVDPRTGKFACRGTLYDQIWIYGFNGSSRRGKLQYDYSGGLATNIPTFVPGAYVDTQNRRYPGAPAGFFVVGDPGTAGDAVTDTNSPLGLNSTFIPETTTQTIFAQGGYDVTESIELYTEVLLNRRESKSHDIRQFWTYLYTGDYGDPFSAGFTGPYILSPTPVTDKFDQGQKVDYMRGVVGLKGDFGSFLQGWDWDIFTQVSRSDGEYSQEVILADAVYSSDGRSDDGSFGLFNENSIPRPTASCVGYKTPVSNRSCVDVSWVSPDFLAGKYTAAEEAFLFDTEVGKTVYDQIAVEGSVSGNLFTLPAGSVGAAFGFHMRKDKISDTPGAVSLAGNSWGLSTAGITKGEDKTKEVFAELDIPLIKAMPFVDRLDLSLSGRYTDVDSYGSNSTYKVGLNWQVMPSLRVRATKGTSFRAPALFELYLANQTSFASQRLVDPCVNWANNLLAGTLPQRIADNCQAAGVPGDQSGNGSSATVVSGGGKGLLEAETSDAKTLGVIWSPSFANLQVAVDYFEIEVNDEVTKLGAANIVAGCYNSETFPTDPLCNQFTRQAGTFYIEEVQDNYLNVASQVNRGIDLTIDYGYEFDFGKFNVNLQSTWQLEDTTELFAGNEVDTNGDVGDPDWTGSMNLRFDRGDWTGFWAIDAIGKASEAEDIGDTNAAKTIAYKVHTEFTAYHSLSVRKKMDQLSVLVGVSNLFNELPPAATQGLGQYSTIGKSVLASQYDYYGRRAFVNITKRF
ncbi:TonB-dependent receptor [Caulobacter sp. B11]|uniref:TonB-dependent receptor domain-containing protein n=1 Tax=Caulobacter sp. B11 TaxID=2048899 RepID=UPI000C12A429|nr:TonB-dependent receptor [Caulobacter sp. B11]PHY14122.1 TonB-dependent receptor [Caulobacter sp. B11]